MPDAVDQINDLIETVTARQATLTEVIQHAIEAEGLSSQQLADALVEIRKSYVALQEQQRGLGEGLEVVMGRDDAEPEATIFFWRVRSSGNRKVLAEQEYETKAARDHAVDTLFPTAEQVDG